MTHRIAILGPDPADQDYHSRWRDVFEGEARILARAGLAVESRAWVDDLAGFDLILPLLTWGYCRAAPQWQTKVAAWAAAGLPVLNPPSVLSWNVDKSYLGRLAERGAPVVPTLYVDRVTDQALAEAAAAFGTDALIAKPRISASAWQTIRWSPGAPLDGGPEGAAMIQPFMPAILDEGELSLVYLAASRSCGRRAGSIASSAATGWSNTGSAARPAWTRATRSRPSSAAAPGPGAPRRRPYPSPSRPSESSPSRSGNRHSPSPLP